MSINEIPRKDRAVITDLDGVIVHDLHLQGGVALDYFSRGLSTYTSDNLSPRVINRDQLQGTYKLLMYFLHYARPVMGNAKRIIPALSNYADLYGSTGRANYDSWIDMTHLTFMRANIHMFFTRVDFTPPGISSTESKLATVYEVARQGYDDVLFVDNNPVTAIKVRQALKDMPNLEVAIVRDWTTKYLLSAVDLSLYNNTWVADNFAHAVKSRLPEDVWLATQPNQRPRPK